jgi:hypothetical protein
MLSDAAQNDPAMSGQLDYERHDHDFYATPQENVDCLHLVEPLDGTIWWEPACGTGHISKRVEELTGIGVYSTDLIDRATASAASTSCRSRRSFWMTKAAPPSR